MRRAFVIGTVLTVSMLAAGCSSGRKIVPVSGTVTVNGQPAAGLIVSFQPLGGEGEQNPGRGSSAVTGSDGKFTLIYDGEKPGAFTGKHRVRIFPQLGAEKGQDDNVPTPKGPAKVSIFIPAKWNEDSQVEFDVPSQGTDKADFNIEIAPKK